MGQPGGQEEGVLIPQAPESVQETGLSFAYICELLLKTMHQGGTMSAQELTQFTKLPFANVVDDALKYLADEQMCEVSSGGGYMATSWSYQLSSKGRVRVKEFLERDGYVGPAPVSIDDYVAMVQSQSLSTGDITPETVKKAFGDLVVEELFSMQVGPAVRSGKSLFLYGPPGNGKTSVAERITRMLSGHVWVPYAVQAGGQVITVFDTTAHVAREDLMDKFSMQTNIDERWRCCDRPMVIVGGELTFQNLDLMYDVNARFYTCPIQMKSNNGVLLIDDFGRQRISPKELLNRWIVPLEKRRDYLNLVTGRQISIPFDILVVFSTNLDPKDLADEAFLRRIKYKMPINDPPLPVFRKIFQKGCEQRGIPFREDMFQWMLDSFWKPKNRPMRCCQPRDILDQIVDKCRFENVQPQLSAENIKYACDTYFVEF